MFFDLESVFTFWSGKCYFSEPLSTITQEWNLGLSSDRCVRYLTFDACSGKHLILEKEESRERLIS